VTGRLSCLGWDRVAWLVGCRESRDLKGLLLVRELKGTSPATRGSRRRALRGRCRQATNASEMRRLYPQSNSRSGQLQAILAGGGHHWYDIEVAGEPRNFREIGAGPVQTGERGQKGGSTGRPTRGIRGVPGYGTRCGGTVRARACACGR